MKQDANEIPKSLSGTLKFSNPAVKEETKHTPGPWSYRRTHEMSVDHWYVIVDSNGKGPIVDVGGKDFDGQIAEAKYLVTDPKEIEANAKLIASAPDLLKENQELKDRCQVHANMVGQLAEKLERKEALNAELLEVLEDIMKIKSNFDNSGWYNTQWIKAQSAITKAKAQ